MAAYINGVWPLNRRRTVFYLQQYFLALGSVLPKFSSFSSNSRLDVHGSLSEICKSVIEIFWDKAKSLWLEIR